MFYLQMNALQHTIKIIVLPSFSRHKLKPLSKCCVFKVRQYIYLKPKVTLHCYYIYLFWVLVSGILNVLNSYLTSINYSYDS